MMDDYGTGFGNSAIAPPVDLVKRPQYPPSQQVGRWQVTWYDGEGGTNIRAVVGKLVLQEHHVLIMDPETKAIKWSVPCVNAGPVTPA